MIENNQLYCDCCGGSLVGVEWQRTPAGKILCAECMGTAPAPNPGRGASKSIGCLPLVLSALTAHFLGGMALAISFGEGFSYVMGVLLNVAAAAIWIAIPVRALMMWTAPGWAKAMVVLLAVIALCVAASAIALNSEWQFWGVAVPLR